VNVLSALAYDLDNIYDQASFTEGKEALKDQLSTLGVL
jgi:hypothetical protein